MNGLRKAYKGGFTFLNPIYREKDVKNVVNLDVNSLYPFVFYSKSLPIDFPKYYQGKYEDDKIYNLYIQRISCSFKLKKNKIPCIQIKNNPRFIGNEYLESSDNENLILTLTNVDLQLFLDHYDVFNIEYLDGWKFKSVNGLFKEYTEKWIERKNEATIQGNKGIRTLCKLMLNSLYGKFAKALENISKIPYLGDDDIVHYKLGEKEEVKGIYVPVACFITSYAREITIRTSQKIKEYSISKYKKDMYIYSDTDSIKTLLPIEELKQFCEIDDVKLGAWKNEGIATKGKWVRQKCYLEEIDEKVNITCAGMPKRCYSQVEWNKFKIGLSVQGKLTFKHVIGGVKLVETDFTIKDQKFIKSINIFSKKEKY